VNRTNEIQVRSKATEFNLDLDRFAVGGVSAGGHLSAVISHLCRDENIPLRLQILTVPATDLHRVFTPEGKFDRENCPYESYREMEFAPALPAARMAYFHRQFLGVPRPAESDEVSPSFIIANCMLIPLGLENIADPRSQLSELGSCVGDYRGAGSSARRRRSVCG
jgi:hypothetical protein